MNKLQKILSGMTTDEKICQLIQLNGKFFIETDIDLTGTDDKLDIPSHALKDIGSTLSLKPGESFVIQKKHLENNKIPMAFMMDVIHGYRTIYPIPLALGCSFNPETVTECCRMAAEEASAGGIHATFSPMVDLVRDARWGRVMESCGESSYLNCVMGEAHIRGYHGESLKNDNSLATCAKHYIGYGAGIAGKDYNTADMSENSLREYYLPAFKTCIDAGVTMIMPSFNTINGIPSIANSHLMQAILKKELNYDRLVISDYNATRELITHGIAENKKEAALISFKNGCHIEMCADTYYLYLKELISEGMISESELDDAVLKVLEFKDELGLFENPYRGYRENASQLYLSDKNRDIAKKAAEESAVLLKNDGILPLSQNIKKVAVIGPYADNKAINGSWACCGNTDETVSLYSGIKKLIPDAKIYVENGCSNLHGDKDKSGFKKAISVAKKSDIVILCLGEPSRYSGEGQSRADLNLPGLQNELAKEIIKHNKNTVAVIFSGRPNILTELNNSARAILHMWFPGTEGGTAVAELLFGKANPSGKLAITFPKSNGQCPIYHDYYITGRPKTNLDNYEPFTSGYLDCSNSPEFSFGFGLSYSDFLYESLEISSDKLNCNSEINVKITVKNKSCVPGYETILLFIRDTVASVAQPKQKLIAFDKVYFNADETKTVEFTINEEMLRFYNYNCEFKSEKGEFAVSTGYADNLILTKKFVLI